MRALVLSVIAIAAIGIGVALPYGMNGNSSGSSIPTDENSVSLPASNDSTNNATGSGGGFEVLADPDLPTVNDPDLRVEKVAEGLAFPTSMAFVDNDDILVLQKENGMVRFISNGKLQDDPVQDVFVNKVSERGLLGIAVDTNSASAETTVFLYYTEEDGEVRNRVYRYEWSADGNMTGGTLVLDLPGTPGPNHDGGKLTIGPDGMLYAVIGDLNRNGMLQNFPSGDEPDDTSVILRVDFSGNAASDAVLSDEEDDINRSLSKYYAYGVRNSFGIDFDPLTGILWDTENGPSGYDEINVVNPGFNSGWERIMGPAERSNADESDLVTFNGSHYSDPVFSWRSAQGITDIEFLNSTSLGEEYENNIFIGDINNGNLYFFSVNEERNGLSFGTEGNNAGGLSDLVADNNEELEEVTFGSGFGGITDIETGPDGFLYILTYPGDLYRLVPDS